MHPIERLRYVARASGTEQGLLVQETAGALAAFADDPAGLVTACRRIVGRHVASAPLWWLCGRVLTAVEPMPEAWAATREVAGDATAGELAHSLAQDATVCVLGWPEQVGEALPRRGDLEVLVVDALGEGSGFVRALGRADVDAIDVPVAGLGAAVTASDVVLLEASMVGPGAALAVAGSLAAACVATHVRNAMGAGPSSHPAPEPTPSGPEVWVVAGVGRLVPGRIFDHAVRRLAGATDPWDADDDTVPLSLVDRIVGPTGPLAVTDAIRRTDCAIAPELFKEL